MHMCICNIDAELAVCTYIKHSIIGVNSSHQCILALVILSLRPKKKVSCFAPETFLHLLASQCTVQISIFFSAASCRPKNWLSFAYTHTLSNNICDIDVLRRGSLEHTDIHICLIFHSFRYNDDDDDHLRKRKTRSGSSHLLSPSYSVFIFAFRWNVCLPVVLSPFYYLLWLLVCESLYIQTDYFTRKNHIFKKYLVHETDTSRKVTSYRNIITLGTSSLVKVALSFFGITGALLMVSHKERYANLSFFERKIVSAIQIKTEIIISW